MFEGSGPLFYKQNDEEQKIVKVYQNIKICKTILDVPNDLLVSGRWKAIPCLIEPAQRRLTRRAPPRSSAEIQTRFIMYPWQASLPRGRKFEKRPSAAGEMRAKKQRRSYFYIYISDTQYKVPPSGQQHLPPARVVQHQAADLLFNLYPYRTRTAVQQ